MGEGTEDKDRKDGGKGFAGLSSLVSNIDSSSVNSGRPSTALPSNEALPVTAAPDQAPLPAQPRLQPQTQTNYQALAQPSGMGSISKWLIGISVVLVLIWLVSQSDKGSSGTAPSYSSANTSSSTPTSPPVWQQPAAPTPAQVTSRPTEETPPVGSGKILTAPQIRYCTAESIRLDAAKEVINQYNDSDIDRFNALVADYNSRCVDYQYRKGVLETARREVERFRSDYVVQGRQRFASSTARSSVPAQASNAPPPPTQARPEARVQSPENAAIKLSAPEAESVEAACSTDKYINGPAAYRSCRERQIAQLRNGPRRPDLSGLVSAERESIEAACSSEKYLNGPAEYNRCLTTQLSALGPNNRRPSLASLSSAERDSIEAACSSEKYLNGPAAYNQCLSTQLRALGPNNRRPSLTSLSSAERDSIEAACSSDKYLNGPAAYNQCLSNQLAMLGKQARRPNLSNLSSSQRQSIEAVCSSDKYLNGPAAYNDCLTRQLQQLR